MAETPHKGRKCTKQFYGCRVLRWSNVGYVKSHKIYYRSQFHWLLFTFFLNVATRNFKTTSVAFTHSGSGGFCGRGPRSSGVWRQLVRATERTRRAGRGPEPGDTPGRAPNARSGLQQRGAPAPQPPEPWAPRPLGRTSPSSLPAGPWLPGMPGKALGPAPPGVLAKLAPSGPTLQEGGRQQGTLVPGSRPPHRLQ